MTSTSPSRAGRPKSEQKRKQILQAATDLFLTQGVTGTSMDNVAKHSGVSKQTVYSHFANKDMLYTAVIEHKCQEYRLDPSLMQSSITSEAALRATLLEIGCQFIHLLQDPQVIAMYRIVISEAQNTPHVAELFYQAGPRNSLQSLSRLFHQAAEQRLSEENCTQIAVDFFSLLKGDFYIRCLFGLAAPFSDQQIRHHVGTAVDKIALIFNQQCAANSAADGASH